VVVPQCIGVFVARCGSDGSLQFFSKRILRPQEAAGVSFIGSVEEAAFFEGEDGGGGGFGCLEAVEDLGLERGLGF